MVHYCNVFWPFSGGAPASQGAEGFPKPPSRLAAARQSSLLCKEKLTPDGKAPHWGEKYIS